MAESLTMAALLLVLAHRGPPNRCRGRPSFWRIWRHERQVTIHHAKRRHAKARTRRRRPEWVWGPTAMLTGSGRRNAKAATPSSRWWEGGGVFREGPRVARTSAQRRPERRSPGRRTAALAGVAGAHLRSGRGGGDHGQPSAGGGRAGVPVVPGRLVNDRLGVLGSGGRVRQPPGQPRGGAGVRPDRRERVLPGGDDHHPPRRWRLVLVRRREPAGRSRGVPPRPPGAGPLHHHRHRHQRRGQLRQRTCRRPVLRRAGRRRAWPGHLPQILAGLEAAAPGVAIFGANSYDPFLAGTGLHQHSATTTPTWPTRASPPDSRPARSRWWTRSTPPSTGSTRRTASGWSTWPRPSTRTTGR